MSFLTALAAIPLFMVPTNSDDYPVDKLITNEIAFTCHDTERGFKTVGIHYSADVKEMDFNHTGKDQPKIAILKDPVKWVKTWSENDKLVYLIHAEGIFRSQNVVIELLVHSTPKAIYSDMRADFEIRVDDFQMSGLGCEPIPSRIPIGPDGKPMKYPRKYE